MRAILGVVLVAVVGCGGGGGAAPSMDPKDSGDNVNLCALVASRGPVHTTLSHAQAGCPATLPLEVVMASDGTATVNGLGPTGPCSEGAAGCSDTSAGAFVVTCQNQLTVEISVGGDAAADSIAYAVLPNGCDFTP